MAASGSSSSPYLFAATSGYRSDGDAGLMHVGARYYDAQVGRFITRDTVLTQKPYLYCEHDPVNAVDPTGHDAPDWLKRLWDGTKRFGGGAVEVVGGALATVTLVRWYYGPFHQGVVDSNESSNIHWMVNNPIYHGDWSDLNERWYYGGGNGHYGYAGDMGRLTGETAKILYNFTTR